MELRRVQESYESEITELETILGNQVDHHQIDNGGIDDTATVDPSVNATGSVKRERDGVGTSASAGMVEGVGMAGVTPRKRVKLNGGHLFKEGLDWYYGTNFKPIDRTKSRLMVSAASSYLDGAPQVIKTRVRFRVKVRVHDPNPKPNLNPNWDAPGWFSQEKECAFKAL